MERKLLLTVDKLVRDECAPAVVPAPEFIVALSEAVKQYAQASLLPDLAAFAQHGKRRVVSVDDVKLVARKAPVLAARLARFEDGLNAKKKAARQGKKARTTTTTPQPRASTKLNLSSSSESSSSSSSSASTSSADENEPADNNDVDVFHHPHDDDDDDDA